MKQGKRHNMILEALVDKGAASTVYLSERIGVSEATVRRDIQALVSINPDVRRVHGGIELRDAATNLEYMFDLKLNRNVEDKLPIAAAAASLIKPNQTVIIDSGSTCYFTALQIARIHGVRIVTVDIKIAEALGRFENITTIVIGGQLRPGFYTIGDYMAIEMLSTIKADIALLSVDGISTDFGVSNTSIFEVGIKKQIIRSSLKSVAVFDKSKIGVDQPHQVCEINKLDTIITNSTADRKELDKIRKIGIEVINV